MNTVPYSVFYNQTTEKIPVYYKYTYLIFIQFLARKGKVYNMKYGEIGTFISLRLHTVNCSYLYS
jgi:hypothetical protein